MKPFLKDHGPWIFLMIMITAQSSISRLPIPDVGINYFDKLLHFFVFGILGAFIQRGMMHSDKRFIKKYALLISIGIGLLFALSDEWHQSFVPGRISDSLDWIADALGIIIFACLYSKFMKSEKGRINSI